MTSIKRCASVWSCPTCSARICWSRGQELQELIDAHVEGGGDVLFVTATLPHHSGHSLFQSAEAVTDAWSYLKAGAPWRRWAERIGYMGAVTAKEPTHGANGWHPHVHALFFISGSIDDRTMEEFDVWLTDRWARKIEAFQDAPLEQGPNGPRLARRNLTEKPREDDPDPLFGRPHPRIGIRVVKGEKAGRYVAKMGLGREATRMDVKSGRDGNRTPLQILKDYAEHGDPHDAALWVEYCRVMKGRRHLVWSPGLKEKLEAFRGRQLELLTDEEAAAGPEPGDQDELVVQIDRVLWWGIRKALPELSEQWVCRYLDVYGLDSFIQLVRTAAVNASIQGEVRHDRAAKRLWLS